MCSDDQEWEVEKENYSKWTGLIPFQFTQRRKGMSLFKSWIPWIEMELSRSLLISTTTRIINSSILISLHWYSCVVVFCQLDPDNTGFIAVENFTSLVEHHELQLDPSKLDMLFALVQNNEDGQVCYQELIELVSGWKGTHTEACTHTHTEAHSYRRRHSTHTRNRIIWERLDLHTQII